MSLSHLVSNGHRGTGRSRAIANAAYNTPNVLIICGTADQAINFEREFSLKACALGTQLAGLDKVVIFDHTAIEQMAHMADQKIEMLERQKEAAFESGRKEVLRTIQFQATVAAVALAKNRYDMVAPYAEFIRNHPFLPADRRESLTASLNAAIMRRWSKGTLGWIKTKAWNQANQKSA